MVFFGEPGVISDAFLAAWQLPNLFRKIFAEGALSASFVPVFVGIVRSDKKKQANGLMTISFLFFEGILVLMCLGVILFPGAVLFVTAPGFSAEQIAYAIPLLRILFPFIFFISSSALLAGALQSVNHFIVPALSQPLLNVFWISFLTICIYGGYSVKVLSVGIILGGIAQLLLHLSVYHAKGFSFGRITHDSRMLLKKVLTRFVPCLLGVSVMEVNLYLDGVIASYLPPGSRTLIYYGNRFMQIPIGIFAVALSTTLLPHFSRVVLRTARRMRLYVLEITKLVSWVILPVMFLLMFESRHIFHTFLYTKKTSASPDKAALLLTIYVSGLLFFCLNKVLTSIFYAYKDTWAPSKGFALSAVVNIVGNFIGIYFFGIYGVALATVASGITLTIFFFLMLWRRHNIPFYFGRYAQFFVGSLLHITLCCIVFLMIRTGVFYLIGFTNLNDFFTGRWGYWFIEMPLIACFGALLILTRKQAHLKLHFLDV